MLRRQCLRRQQPEPSEDEAEEKQSKKYKTFHSYATAASDVRTSGVHMPVHVMAQMYRVQHHHR